MSQLRRIKREKTRSADYLQQLFANYLKARQANYAIKDENVIYSTHLLDNVIPELNYRWRSFASTKHKKFDVKAFERLVKKDMLNHIRNVWIRFTQNLLDEYYGLEKVPAEQLQPLYSKNMSANDAAIEVVCGINPFVESFKMHSLSTDHAVFV